MVQKRETYPSYQAHVDDLRTGNRLMKFSYWAGLPDTGHLPDYEKFIVLHVAERHRWRYRLPLEMTAQEIYAQTFSRNDFLDNLLIPLFVTESLLNVWGRLLLQLTKPMVRIGDATFSAVETPFFMLPLHCVVCGTPLKGITQYNLHTEKKWKCGPKDNPTGHSKCSEEWARIRKTYETALNHLKYLTATPENYERDKCVKGGQYIAAAYSVLCKRLEPEPWDYVPRYFLIPDYKQYDLGWFVHVMLRDGLPLEQDLPMLDTPTKGYTIATMETEDGGLPADSSGNILQGDKIIKLSDLGGYFRNPAADLPAIATL